MYIILYDVYTNRTIISNAIDASKQLITRRARKIKTKQKQTTA